MRLRSLGIFVATLFCLCAVLAMTPDKKKSAVKKQQQTDERVHLIHADKLYFDEQLHPTAQFLVGNVQFEHKGVLMYCDSALFYESTNSFDAYGNVRMNQGDTLSLVGDVLFYNGLDEMARARYHVVLKHLETTLYTDSLDYDRIYDMGYFFEGGRLIDNDNQLTSDWGQYSPSTREAVFNYNVKLVNPLPPKPTETTLISDTLHYNTRTAIAHIVGPSNIENKESHVYSESGYYNTKTDESYLLDRSILTNNGKRLVGDSVVWDSEHEVGKAYGHVEYNDVVNKSMFTGNYCYYDDKNGYAEAADSAVGIDYSQRDTMYIHADSFRVYTYFIDTDSMYRVLHAYRHVRSYRRDVQSVCDSMVYNSKDSCLIMYKDPILWQMGQQLLGEEIHAFMNDSTMDSIQVLRQTLSVERLDSMRYNQMAGEEMHTYFRDGQVYLNTVHGNVLANYYPFDADSIMIGMNHIETTDVKFFMENRKLQKIWTAGGTGTLYPVLLVPPSELYLQNFAWFDYIRPVDKNDIFEWRSKKDGSQLKKGAPRNSAPRQKLSDIKQQQASKQEKKKKQ